MNRVRRTRLAAPPLAIAQAPSPTVPSEAVVLDELVKADGLLTISHA